MRSPLNLTLVAAVFAAMIGAACGDTDDPASSSDASTSDTGSEADATAEDTGASDTSAADAALDVPVEPVPEVVIATFNVSRFFDTECDSGRCDSGDFESRLSNAQFNYKVSLIVEALDRIDADIVVLQEIEKEACLTALNEALDPAFDIAVLGEIGGNATLDVAVLARGELIEVRGHRDTPIPRPTGGQTTFSRELLEVELELEGQRVIVFAAHFKSKNNDDASRRLAEAMAAREIIAERAASSPDALVVLGGDLNDTPGSPPIDALEDGGALRRVAEELGDEAWTIRFFDERQAIDHLYLAVDASGSYVGGSAEVIRDSSGRLAQSDHAALRATFALPAPDASAD